MQQFLWAEWYLDLMDGTVGLSCQPVEISGRNYMLRHAATELIRHDPAWKDGDYAETPTLQCRGFRRPADARRARTRLQEDRARHRQGHARAFHALLRGDLEAVSGEIHIQPAAGAAGSPMKAVF
jgi:homoserine acetyltransferase